MDYKQIYDNIINRAKSEGRRKRSKSDNLYIYYEHHHILPKCLGGTNTKDNTVLLTAREHFVVHQLLVKLHSGNRSLWYSVYAMRACNQYQIRNNKDYSWIRESRKHIGLTDEEKAHLSKINKGKKLSQEVRDKISASNKGRVVSEDTRVKIGEKNSKNMRDRVSRAGYKIWNKDVPMTESAKTKLSRTLEEQYSSGRPISSSCFRKGYVPWNKGKGQVTLTCPVCNISGGSSVMKRWHFDNCKFNK